MNLDMLPLRIPCTDGTSLLGVAPTGTDALGGTSTAAAYARMRPTKERFALRFAGTAAAASLASASSRAFFARISSCFFRRRRSFAAPPPRSKYGEPLAPTPYTSSLSSSSDSGAFAPAGEPLALAAIAAEGRRWRALAQAEMQEHLRAALEPETLPDAFLSAHIAQRAVRRERAAWLAKTALPWHEPRFRALSAEDPL